MCKNVRSAKEALGRCQSTKWHVRLFRLTIDALIITLQHQLQNVRFRNVTTEFKLLSILHQLSLLKQLLNLILLKEVSSTKSLASCAVDKL